MRQLYLLVNYRCFLIVLSLVSSFSASGMVINEAVPTQTSSRSFLRRLLSCICCASDEEEENDFQPTAIRYPAQINFNSQTGDDTKYVWDATQLLTMSSSDNSDDEESFSGYSYVAAPSESKNLFSKSETGDYSGEEEYTNKFLQRKTFKMTNGRNMASI